MKKALIVLLCLYPLLSFSQETVNYEYLSIFKIKGTLYISIGTEEFIEVDVKKEMENNNYDFTPVHQRIEKYEAEGWEFVTANQSWSTFHNPNLTCLVIMKRIK